MGRAPPGLFKWICDKSSSEEMHLEGTPLVLKGNVSIKSASLHWRSTNINRADLFLKGLQYGGIHWGLYLRE